jgi:hypothetical protein
MSGAPDYFFIHIVGIVGGFSVIFSPLGFLLVALFEYENRTVTWEESADYVIARNSHESHPFRADVPADSGFIAL